MQHSEEPELTWYGDAGLVLRCGEQSIAFDPFVGLPIGSLKQPPQVLPYQEVLRRVNGVFVTHGHFDHIYHIPQLYGGRGTPIFCTDAPAKTLERNGVPGKQIRRIQPGWEGEIGAFRIRAWQSEHCHFDSPLIAKTILRKDFFRHPGHLLRLVALDAAYPEKREILFYEVCCGGKRIQIMGSMNLSPKVCYPTGADLLVLPLQGRSDQDTYALELVERLRPGVIALDHCDNAFPPMSADIDGSGFIKNVWNRFEIPCRLLTVGKPIALKELLSREEKNYGQAI